MTDTTGRISVAGRIIDLLWNDDEFYRDVSSHKKASSSGKFPRCDQWCDDSGFHIAFALAGYSPDDVKVQFKGYELFIEGFGSKIATSPNYEETSDTEEYPKKSPSLGVQQGMIVRGIARRNFKAKFFINPLFDLKTTTASMKDGLLEVVISARAEANRQDIHIKEL